MPTSKLTSKGRITMPKEVRDRLGLRPGDKVEFMPDDSCYVVRKHVAESPFRKYVGYLSDLAGQDVDELVEEMRSG